MFLTLDINVTTDCQETSDEYARNMFNFFVILQETSDAFKTSMAKPYQASNHVLCFHLFIKSKEFKKDLVESCQDLVV